MSESSTGEVGCWPATSGRAGAVTDDGVPVADSVREGDGWIDSAGVDVALPVAPSTVVLVSVTGEVFAPPAGSGLGVAASRAPEHAAATKTTNASGMSFCRCMVSIVWTGVERNLITRPQQIVTHWSVYI